MRTLVFHDGALGDVLLSLPCINAIGKHSSTPDVVCRGDAGRLLRSSGVADRAFSPDSGMFASWYTGHPDKAALELLEQYGRAFVFTLRADAGLAKSIARAVPDTQVLITVPPAGDRTHVAEFRLRQLPSELRDYAPVRLAVSADVRQQAKDVLEQAGCNGHRHLIVLHPGSGGKSKCWPLERYFALAEKLIEGTDACILFLSGPAEEPTVKERVEAFVRAHVRMAHIADADLAVIAAMLARCGLFAGNDSGISHLAAAAGAPVIALFGPTDPALWRPCGDAVRVVAAGAMEGISVDAVLAAADEAGIRNFSA